MVTCIGLDVFPEGIAQAAYFYVTILVSALNCIYDAVNRWCSGTKSFKNSKLLLIIVSAFAVAAYCVVVVFGMLITGNTNLRNDLMLLFYLLVAVVAFADVVACFVKETAWITCIATTEVGEVTK